MIKIKKKRFMRQTKGQTGNDAFLSDNAVYAGPAPKDLAKRHDDYRYGGIRDESAKFCGGS